MDRHSFRPSNLARHARARLSPAVHASLERFTTREFAIDYHRKPERTWRNTRWMGVDIQKLPADMWVYQELLHELRPDLIIETGTLYGGSALYLANLLDLIGHGGITSIDVDTHSGRPQHDRITYLQASSSDPVALAPVLAKAAASNTVMVILDSDHRREHVLAELDLLAGCVTSGSYLIVEDGNVNGHPVMPLFGPGPTEALDEWLPKHPEFTVDVSREKFMHTFNPGGYLERAQA